jgi:hypothetical protein
LVAPWFKRTLVVASTLSAATASPSVKYSGIVLVRGLVHGAPTADSGRALLQAAKQGTADDSCHAAPLAHSMATATAAAV